MSVIKKDLRVGESINLDNGRVIITVLEKSGQRVRVNIDANQDVAVRFNTKASQASIAKSGIVIPS